MTDLLKLTAVEARAGLDSRAFSSVELTNAYLAAMDTIRPLNQYVTETADQALAPRGFRLPPVQPFSKALCRNMKAMLQNSSGRQAGCCWVS